MHWFFQLQLIIDLLVTILCNSSALGVPHRSHPMKKALVEARPSEKSPKRDDAKRGLDIGLQVKIPTEKSSESDMKDMKDDMLQELRKEIAGGKNEEILEKLLDVDDTPKRMLLKPAFECDAWDSKTRSCTLERNTGDTVTFSLSTGKVHGRPDVIWKKEFAEKDSVIKKEYVIDPKSPSRNLVIGRRGYELRISPITELDVGDNHFSASFVANTSTPLAKVNFKIRIVPEDLGFVYIGETLDLAIDSYVTLPLESLTYHWYTEKEGDSSTLPSNMRVSTSGTTLRISELRQEQEGIIACSVYTNKGMHATKKRFLMNNLAQNKDILKSFGDHNITFKEELKRKRHKPLREREKRATSISPPTRTKLRNSKSGREIKQANLEGEQYTLVKPGSRQQDSRNNDRNEQDLQDGELDSDDQTHDISFSYGNSTDQDTIINIELRNSENMEDDKVSQLISHCSRDIECSKHASCRTKRLRQKGFCRCLRGFYGPGIFCREDM